MNTFELESEIYKLGLTPSSVRFPIRAHLSTTTFVSGNMAFSHAPSLLNSSARPWIANTKVVNIL